MQLFYCEGIRDNQLFLDPEESHHCTHVLRKKTGDVIAITDGQGRIYQAQIENLNKKKCTFSVQSFEEFLRPEHHIHIAIAPTKSSDRIEWFVEKAVEIGVDKISFIYSEHSERKFLNLDRVKKKAKSAMKQSLRAYLPELAPLQTLHDFLEQTSEYQNKFIAHLDNKDSKHLADLAGKSEEYLILIGPEGGFSEGEVSLLKQQGYKAAKIGDYRLRTETAGIVACSILNDLNRS